jgi:hypothetical protein
MFGIKEIWRNKQLRKFGVLWLLVFIKLLLGQLSVADCDYWDSSAANWDLITKTKFKRQI